jgi:hypothetical protein
LVDAERLGRQAVSQDGRRAACGNPSTEGKENPSEAEDEKFDEADYNDDQDIWFPDLGDK